MLSTIFMQVFDIKKDNITYKSENTEWAIKKEQSRDTGNIVWEHMMERRQTKQNTTTLTTKNMSDTDSAIQRGRSQVLVKSY